MTDNVATILAERRTQHGPFVLHAAITQRLKAVIHSDIGGWDHLNDSQRECLEMVVHKIGRILAGDPNHIDHWDDIAGYSTLVANELRERSGK